MRRRTARLGCRQVVEMVTEYLEGALTADLAARLEEHLAACRHCAAYLRQMQVVVGALGRLAAPPLDRRTRDELVERYRRWTAA